MKTVGRIIEDDKKEEKDGEFIGTRGYNRKRKFYLLHHPLSRL